MHAHKVQFGCSYLVPGVSIPDMHSFHRLTLSWDKNHPDLPGTFHIDPNSCGLDEFGDTTMCTEMASAVQEMKLTLLKEKPGKRVYDIAVRSKAITPPGETPPPPAYHSLPLRLVTIAEHGGKPMQARLIALNADKAIDRIIDLQAV